MERRKGMQEFDDRLKTVELIVKSELGQPGEDGRIHKRITGMERTLTGIRQAVQGDNGAGLGERVRRLEGFRDAGTRGGVNLIGRVTKLEGNQRLIIGGLSGVATAVATLFWGWVQRTIFGGGA